MRNIWACGMLVAVTMVISGCKSNGEGHFSGDSARELVREQLSFGDRIPGTEAHDQTGEWIIDQLEASGWDTWTQEFEYRGIELRNIIGRRGDHDTALPIIFGAHYDTRPMADLDSKYPHLPVPGANDGASGVAVLLELARVLEPENLTHPVWLVFFDAEDSGNIDGWDWIVGSMYFVEHMTVIPHAVLIVDMVGDEDLELYFERNSDPALSAEIWSVAADLDNEAFIPESKFSIIDDHTPFLQAGMCAIDIIDFDYRYWHTTKDTLNKVSAKSLEQVGRTLQVWLESIQE